MPSGRGRGGVGRVVDVQRVVVRSIDQATASVNMLNDKGMGPSGHKKDSSNVPTDYMEDHMEDQTLKSALDSPP